MKSLAFVVLPFVFQACRGAPADALDVVQPATAGSIMDSEQGGSPEVAVAELPTCEPALVLSPSSLATQWPGLVGKRVRLRLRPLRALSFAEWLASAGGQRFIVLATPGTRWADEHVFLITGSTVAPVHGRTALPELVLDDDCSA